MSQGVVYHRENPHGCKHAHKNGTVIHNLGWTKKSAM